MNSFYKVLGFPPDDERLILTRHTGTTYPITRFRSVEEADARREELRFNLRMAAGLYPWPEKTPLNLRCEAVDEEQAGTFEGYTVQKIMF